MHEIVINIHMHTTYSDGHVTHTQIAQAALQAGIDAVVVTDHNVLVNGMEKYYEDGSRSVLMLVGEEVHDQAREPQKNHLLVFGVQRELATFASDSQHLIDMVNQEGGLCFIAHPDDPASPVFGETDISWEDWQVQGYTGIELWNAMSEFKSLLSSKLHGLYYAFNPERIAVGPTPKTLAKWDQLLLSGKKVVAIGGSDAHALPAQLGPIKRVIFPYEFHFRTVNTHLYIPHPLTGEFETDRKMILSALSAGRAFIGYDLPASTNGFRFYAHGMERTAWAGEEISAQRGITFQVCLPRAVECRMIKDGETLKSWNNRETYTFITSEPGVYRVEAYINFYGQRRGWIFSNPIYVMK